jgi:hypothetical protein
MKSYIVDLEHFDKTDLERELDKKFGHSPRTVLQNVERTYFKYLRKYASTNITVRTNKLNPQIYKVGAEEINIIN